MYAWLTVARAMRLRRFLGGLMAIRAEDAQPVQHDSLPPVTIGWFVRRTIVGIAILMVAMGSLAWLTYASIEPDEGSSSSTATAPSERPAQLIPIDL